MTFVQRYNHLITLFADMNKFLMTVNDVGGRVFDRVKPYVDKYPLFAINNAQFGHIKIVPYSLVNTYDNIDRYYNEFIAKGAEGIVVRNLDGKYELSSSRL